MLGASLSLTRLSLGRGAAAGPGVVTDPGVTAVQASGWKATYPGPPAFDPVADPRHVVVRRSGFGAGGAPTTVTEALLLTTRIREPWPNHGSLTPSDVALGDMVYAGEAIDGVTNNSTRAYPKPQALWLHHDMEVATGSIHTVRLAVMHRHARAGRPVAAVTFTASDGVATVSATVSDMALTSWAASGLTVPHFAAALDLSTLAPGVVTIDATIFPWVGEAFTVSTDADPHPSPNLTVLKVLNDRDGSFGTAYAQVDTAGSDATGTVSADPAAAAAAPFATVAAAAAAVQSFNAATYGRNDASGGIVRLNAGTHTHANFSTVAVGAVPLVIEAAGAKAATVYRDAGASISNGIPDRLKLRGLTLRRNAASNVVFLDSAAGALSGNMLVIEDCDLDDAGLGTPWAAWIWRVGRFWLIGCGGDDLGQAAIFASEFKAVVALGSGQGSVRRQTYHALGCRDLAARYEMVAAGGDRPAYAGPFVGWCHLGQGTSGQRCLQINTSVGVRGAAIVGNVFEQYGSDVGPVAAIAEVEAAALDNVNVVGNSAVGSRTNMAYQAGGAGTVAKQAVLRFNVFDEANTKGDVFGGDATLVGNWQVLFKVGACANGFLRGGSDADSFGVGRWVGEIPGAAEAIGSDAAPLPADWADDRSFSGLGTGGGDYTPGALHQLPSIPAGAAPWSHDQKGRPLANDGTAVAGALQPL